MSQLVRLCDINLEAKSFFKDVREMTLKFIKQGYKQEALKDTFFKFSYKYLYKWSKYGIDITDSTFALFS